MVSPQHNAGVSRPHRTTHSSRQQLIGTSNCAWERHVHEVLIFFQMLEGQVSKIVHSIVYNKTGHINKLMTSQGFLHMTITINIGVKASILSVYSDQTHASF